MEMEKEVLKYFGLCLWFAKNQESKDYTTDQFEQVLIKIGGCENQLWQLGMGKKGIQMLIDQVARAYKVSLTVEAGPFDKTPVSHQERWASTNKL